jgi:hypothetical protein
MTKKADFTDQEWDGLLTTPVLAGTYIIIADMSVTAVPKEMKGLFSAMMNSLVPVEAEDLITSLVEDIKRKSESKEKIDQPQIEQGQDVKRQLLESLQAKLAVLDGKAAPGEKAAFCQWLLGLAQATAEAGREGGFMGIGSVRISEQEKAALAELKEAIGVH